MLLGQLACLLDDAALMWVMADARGERMRYSLPELLKLFKHNLLSSSSSAWKQSAGLWQLGSRASQ